MDWPASEEHHSGLHSRQGISGLPTLSNQSIERSCHLILQEI